MAIINHIKRLKSLADTKGQASLVFIMTILLLTVILVIIGSELADSLRVIENWKDKYDTVNKELQETKLKFYEIEARIWKINSRPNL